MYVTYIVVSLQSTLAVQSGQRGAEGAGMGASMGSSVNIAGLVGEKEEQLHLKQLVESHHIDIP